MSRSHKYHPYGGAKKWKFGKIQANRKVRRKCNKENVTFDHCSYKRMYPQWNICDYFDYFTLKCMLELYPEDSYEENTQRWLKWYYRK